MAMWGIAILGVYKVVSTVAFMFKERNLRRALMQFLDILVFEEVYLSHNRVVAEFKYHTSKEKAVETTTSFKFARSLEAVFESIPQSVLQLVFLIKTNGDYDGDYLLLAI